MGVSLVGVFYLSGNDSSAARTAEGQSFDRTYQDSRSVNGLIITLEGR
jgi:hypothetical protein